LTKKIRAIHGTTLLGNGITKLFIWKTAAGMELGSGVLAVKKWGCFRANINVGEQRLEICVRSSFTA